MDNGIGAAAASSVAAPLKQQPSSLPSSSSSSQHAGGLSHALSDSTSSTTEHTPVSSNSSSSASLNNLGQPQSHLPAASPQPVADAQHIANTMEKMSIDDEQRTIHPTSLASSSASASSSSLISTTADSSTTSSPASSSSSSGKKKAISYAAERVIGNGSFGVVYQATVIDTGETVAIKKVLQDRRFKNRELEIMSSLSHPNVVALRHCFYSKGDKPDELYLNLVMEYIPETIHRTLRNHTKANKLVPLLYTKVYMYQIARALAYIHSQGICHRDIKPQNLLLNPRTHEVKLCDFGSAKCFAPGTQVRLFNGGLVKVENIVGGERLMGPDGQPRIVTPGSIVRGRAVMYQVEPKWSGAEPFIVNGDHILVLSNNIAPSAFSSGAGGWRAYWFELSSSNKMSRQCSGFMTQDDAEDYAEVLRQGWPGPLQWEVSVSDFLAAPTAVRAACTLFQSGPVTFSSAPAAGLPAVLASVLGYAPSAPQVEWAAWYLGVWITDGVAVNDWISQSGPPSGHLCYQEVMTRLLRYQVLFNEQVTQVADRVSSARHQAYFFKFGIVDQARRDVCAPSIARRLLQAYNLLNNKHVPQAWICDTIEVRRRIFAGVLDGDGHYHSGQKNCYAVSTKSRAVADGHRLLALSLGIRCGAPGPTRTTDSETGERYDGFKVHYSGNMWPIVQYCALTYKQCPQPGQPDFVQKNKDSRCYGIRSIVQLPVGEYHGFAVQGSDRRLLLRDFTVTHNSLHPGEPNVSYICSRYYRAPELVFEATEYTAMIDVWSLGCVFVELLIGNPLFPGDSGVGQLIEIIKVLGSPTRDEVLAMNPTPTAFRFPHISPQPWSKVFRTTKVPPAGIDLASRWLRYKPSERMVPFDSLMHPFFDELREEGVRMPNGKELPELFDWRESERDAMRKAGGRLYERMTPRWYRKRKGELTSDDELTTVPANGSSSQTQMLNGHRSLDNGAAAMDGT